MSGESKSTHDKEWSSLVGFLVATVLLLLGAFYFISNWPSIIRSLREVQYESFAIATRPEGATIVLDGQVVGHSPVTIRVEAGAHTVTARKLGHETESRAISLNHDLYEGRTGDRKLSRKADPWVLNLHLKEIPYDATSAALEALNQSGSEPQATAPASATIHRDMSELRTEIKNVKALILAEPEQALSYGILKGKFDAMERSLGETREQLNTSNDIRLGIIAILIGLVVTVSTTIIRSRKQV